MKGVGRVLTFFGKVVSLYAGFEEDKAIDLEEDTSELVGDLKSGVESALDTGVEPVVSEETEE